MISVIVPARNESSVIARALTAMTSGALLGELEVIVVCNACSDDTAAIAARFGPPVRVLETARAGKFAALNLGDRAALGFPRIYVDADVVITIDALRVLADRLQPGEILAAAPIAKMNLASCSWFVRAFYEIRSRLPSAREGIGGSGVYALSERGRRRFAEFPEVIADDGYVRLQFPAEERETLANVHSTVFPPRRLRDLIVTRTRAHYGTRELYRIFPELRRNAGERNHESVARLFRHIGLWPKLLVYVCVTLAARHRARRRSRANFIGWERDDTSRAAI